MIPNFINVFPAPAVDIMLVRIYSGHGVDERTNSVSPKDGL
jgi:hypothetical protein